MPGGTCWTPEQMRAIRCVADRFGVKIHADGARIFNSAVAQNLDVRELARDSDSITSSVSPRVCAALTAPSCWEAGSLSGKRGMRGK